MISSKSLLIAIICLQRLILNAIGYSLSTLEASTLKLTAAELDIPDDSVCTTVCVRISLILRQRNSMPALTWLDSPISRLRYRLLDQGMHGFEGSCKLLTLPLSGVGLCSSMLLDNVETGGANVCGKGSTILVVYRG